MLPGIYLGIEVQIKNSKAQRNIWRILERELFSYGAIVFFISCQAPIIKQLTIGYRWDILRRTHLQYRLMFTIVTDAYQHRIGVTSDLHAMLRTHGTNNTTASPTVVSSVKHRKYDSLATITFSRLLNKIILLRKFDNWKTQV